MKKITIAIILFIILVISALIVNHSVPVFIFKFLDYCSSEHRQWRRIHNDLENNKFKVTVLKDFANNDERHICGKWTLSTSEILSFLLNSKPVEETQRGTLDWSVCEIDGYLESEKEKFFWGINISGNAHIWNNDGFQSTLKCDSIFYKNFDWSIY